MLTYLGVVRLRRRGRQARCIRAAMRRLPDDHTPVDSAIRRVAKLNFRALAVRVPGRFNRDPAATAFTSDVATLYAIM